MPDLPGLVAGAMIRLLEGQPGWDRPPGLHLVRQAPGRAWVVKQSFAPDVWEGYPPDTLVRLAGSAARVAADLAGGLFLSAAAARGGLCGVVFFCETWMLYPGSDAEREEGREAMQTRQIRYHPQRVETRMAWGALQDGTRLLVIQRRGDQPARQDPDEAGIDPRIPEAVAQIVRAFTTSAAN